MEATVSESARAPRPVSATAVSTVALNLLFKYGLPDLQHQLEPAEIAELQGFANLLNLAAGSKARDWKHWLESVPEWKPPHWFVAAIVYPAAALLG